VLASLAKQHVGLHNKLGLQGSTGRGGGGGAGGAAETSKIRNSTGSLSQTALSAGQQKGTQHVEHSIGGDVMEEDECAPSPTPPHTHITTTMFSVIMESHPRLATSAHLVEPWLLLQQLHNPTQRLKRKTLSPQTYSQTPPPPHTNHHNPHLVKPGVLLEQLHKVPTTSIHKQPPRSHPLPLPRG
jgi:hypothetical protein